MKECVGVGCEHFDCTTYTDVVTGNPIAYCKQCRSQLKINQGNRTVYVDDCVPSIRIVNICGRKYGSVSGREYQ